MPKKEAFFSILLIIQPQLHLALIFLSADNIVVCLSYGGYPNDQKTCLPITEMKIDELVYQALY